MLSDNQRRLICRITFLLICVAPTTGTTYVVFHRPTKAQWAREIKAELGIDTSIDAVETPYPNVAILRGLKFSDPELGKLLEATEVRIDFKSDYQLVTIDHNVHMTNQGLIALMQQINQHVIRRHGASRPWRIQFNQQATIWDVPNYATTAIQEARHITLQDLQIELFSQEDGTDASLSFQLAAADGIKQIIDDNNPHDAITAFIGRSRKNEIGQSLQLIKLDTRRYSLPCWLVADLAPEIKSLMGPDVRFSGQLAINPPADRAYANALRINGQFTQVDGRAIFQRTMHQASSDFEVVIEDCQIFNGELFQWKAELRDGTYRYEIPPATQLSELNIRRAILASVDGFDLEGRPKYY